MSSFHRMFRDRTDAGEVLADRLLKYLGRSDVLVLGLPRGGMPVAAAVAHRLHVPLDFLHVRRLGVPEYFEQTLGALASGGVRVLDDRLIAQLRIPTDEIDAITGIEREELDRRDRLYRGNRPRPAIRGRTIILVDDGVATGFTLRAAVAALRQLAPERVVIAVPTLPRATYHEMRGLADELVEIIAPDKFESIGEWYQDFAPVPDESVQALLAASPGWSRPA